MKKIISIFICLSVFICYFNVQAFAKKNLLVDEKETLDLLQVLEILDDSEGIDAISDTNITRRSFVEYVAKLLKLTPTVLTKEKYFSDVDYGDIINDACSYGIVKQDEFFYPDRDITFQEAYIIAIRALGGESYAAMLGGNSSDYIQVAKMIDFPITNNLSEKMNYKNAVSVLYNILTCNMIEIKPYSSITTTFEKSEKNILNIYYNIYYVEGIVSTNEYLSIYKNINFPGKDYITINNESYYMHNQAGIIGNYVRLYYKDNDIKTGVLVAVQDKYNYISEIDSKDIKSLSFDRVEYYEANKEISLKLNNALYIYNDEALFGYSLNDLKEFIGKDRTKIKIIRHKIDGVQDIVFIESYMNGTIKTVDFNNEKIFVDFYGNVEEVSYSNDVRSFVLFTKDGELADETCLVQDAFVSCFRSYNNKVLKINMTAQSITGKVEEMHTENGSQFAKIDGNVYEIDNNDYLNVKNGDVKTFIIDIWGKIAFVKYNKEKIVCYIYARIVPSYGDEEYEYKIFDENGKHSICKFAKKVEFDGIRMTAFEADKKIVRSNGSFRQFVLISMNKNNEINKINTCSSEDGIYRIGKNIERQAFKYNNGFRGYHADESDLYKEGYCTCDQTILFIVPNENSSSSTDESLFKVTARPNDELTYYYTYELYKTQNETDYVDFMVKYEDSEASNQTLPPSYTEPVMVVDTYEVWADDYIQTVVDVQRNYANPPMWTKYLAEYVTIEKVNGDIILVSSEDVQDVISEGDIIQFGDENVRGHICSIRILFDYSKEETFYGFDDSGEYNYTIESMSFDDIRDAANDVNVSRGLYGYVYDFDYNIDIDNTNVSFSISEIQENGTTGEEHERFGKLSNVRVVMYDSGIRKGRRVTTTRPSDIIGWKNSGGGSEQKVFVYYTAYSRYYAFFYK